MQLMQTTIITNRRIITDFVAHTEAWRLLTDGAVRQVTRNVENSQNVEKFVLGVRLSVNYRYMIVKYDKTTERKQRKVVVVMIFCVCIH
jgi:hypothetical protein